jgi:hypothetical protein
MKHLNATFEIPHDLAEHQLRQTLEGMNVKYMKTLPNTEHLKGKIGYKKLLKAKMDAQLTLDRYINEHR